MLHPLGFIHGRFQVLHNDHLKYLLAGKALCTHLTVGITNPDKGTTASESTNPDRSDVRNNPLTYAERETMVRVALIEANVPESSFEILPFPICKPELLKKIAPKDAIYYLTIYDAWGREKQKRLESLGLRTHVMWTKPESEKGISGTEVRAAIRQGRDIGTMVPPTVAELVAEWNLQKRLSDLSSSGS